MSLCFDEEIKCSVCGNKQSFPVYVSFSSFGPPDLDQRPFELDKKIMKNMLQKCPFCGYVAYDVSEPCPVDRRFLRSIAYRTCNWRFFLSPVAKRYYKQYLIACKIPNDAEAYDAVLHAAWACDDSHDKRNARYCRQLAVIQIDKLIQEADNPKETVEELLLIKADLLRRSGRFSEVVRDYRRIRFSNERMNDIRIYEIKMARRKNSKCCTVDDALEYQKLEARRNKKELHKKNVQL